LGALQDPPACQVVVTVDEALNQGERRGRRLPVSGFHDW
jgi:hypothetical protein